MLDLAPETAIPYLAGRGYDPKQLEVVRLGGGVSNNVLLVTLPGERFVLKQALAKLRVEQEWLSDRGRIRREAEALRALGPLLGPDAVPRVLFEDFDNHLFAMTAAAPQARDWKSLLLEGRLDADVAVTVGRMLGRMQRAGWDSPQWKDRFGDQLVFDQLRLDPYYRSTALRHPDLAAFFEERVEVCRTRAVSLVHGDWSPKNFLVDGSSVMAIDFEVIHYGDPSFDAAFLLNHLLLKAFHRPALAAALAGLAARFWKELTGWLPGGSGWYGPSTLRHLGGLLLARIDGKSPAEYLRDPGLKDRIRGHARELILRTPKHFEGLLALWPQD